MEIKITDMCSCEIKKAMRLLDAANKLGMTCEMDELEKNPKTIKFTNAWKSPIDPNTIDKLSVILICVISPLLLIVWVYVVVRYLP